MVLQTNGTTTAVTISTAQVVTLAQPLPVASGGSGVTTSTGTGAVVLGTSPSISGAVMSTMASSVLTSATAQNSTSGTSIDFTGIPSWVKRITVMFKGVSTSGASIPQIQIGSGSFVTTGYLGAGFIALNLFSPAIAQNSTGFLTAGDSDAAYTRHGSLVLINITGNTWVINGTLGQSDALRLQMCGGSLALSGVLDRVRITTVNGTDTFDAGSINILYE